MKTYTPIFYLKFLLDINLLRKTKTMLIAFIFVALQILAFSNFGFGSTAGPNYPTAGVDSSATGTITWSNTSYITADDANYTTASLKKSEISHYLKGRNFGFSIPTGSTINGITVSCYRSSSGTYFMQDNVVKLIKAGEIVGSNYAQGLSYWQNGTWETATYGGTSNLWGTTWTAEDINNTNFGVVVSAKNSDLINTGTALVDYITITVSYTVPSCTAPTIDATSNLAAICSGGTVDLSSGSSGGSGCGGSWEYAWYTGDGTGSTYYDGTDWNNAENYNSSWSSVASVAPASTTTYKVKVRCSTTTSCNATDATGVEVTVNSDPSISVQPSDQTTCVGGSSKNFSVTVTGGTTLTYQWKYCATSSGTYNNVADGTPTGAIYTNATSATMTVSGISSAGTYYYKCVVSDAGTGCTTPLTSNYATLTVGAAVSSPTAGTHSATETQIVWNWNTVASATGYKYNTVNDYATATDNGTSTSYTQPSLTCNTAYTLYIWAYTASCNSSSTSLSQSTTALSSPGSITNNSPKCDGTGITFTQGTCPPSCTCYWETSASGTSTALGSASTYTSSTVAGTYTMYVRAYSGTCWSTAVSSTGTVNSNPTISGTTSVVVGGTTTLTGSITPGTWSSSNEAVATISSGGVVTGVSAGSSTITFTVDATGCSGTTSVTVISCSTPTNLASSSVTQTSAVITWTAANPAPSSGYDIYYSTSSSSPTGGTTPSASVGAGITTYTIGGLTPGTKYYVWVRSNCGSGSYSSWTSSINFTCTSCGAGYYYYRSKSSGNWSISSTSTWERSSDGSSWSGTSTTPTSSNCCCARIQSGHTITLNANITAPNTIVDANGTLAISNNAITYGNGYVVTNNGTITVSVGGSQVSAWDNKGLVINGTGTLINNGTITINTGGTLTLSSTASGAKIINYGTIDNYGGSFSKISECIYLYIAIYGGINIQDKTLSSTVTNYGTITNHPPSISSGHYYYYAYSGGPYYFRGYTAFYNLDNYGTIANGSVVTTSCNFGIIDLIGYSGIFNNYSGGTVNNYSVLFIGVDGVTCYSSTYNNYGTHNDYSETAIDYGSTFNNKSGASFNIKSTGALALQAAQAACGGASGTNDGTITNSSTSNDDYKVGMYIDGSSSFTNNNIIYDEGKIKNNGTFTNTTTSQFIYKTTTGSISGNALRYKGNALLKYNGTDAQTTSDYEFPSSTSYSPSYVEIDNSSGASKGVTLHANRTINYNTGYPPTNGVPYLTLTNGAFKLNSYTLTIESSSSSAIARNGTTQTGYIVSETLDNSSTTSAATPKNTCTSRIRWNDLGTSASEYKLPFGTTGGTYVPLIVNVTSTATGANGYFTSAIYHTSTSNYPYPSYPETVTNMNNKYGDNSSNAVDRFYLTSFSGYSSNPTVTYTFSYDESNDLNDLSESNLYAQYWNNPTSQWKTGTSTGKADPINNQVNSVSGVNVSRVWVLSNSSNPLPVELLYFTASCKNRNIFFKWATASETNNDYFVIEKKINNDWKKITKVNGNGNTNYINEYTAFDINPSQNTLNGSETSYYRLKQTDYNGNYEAFEPIPITCDEDKMYDYFNAYLDENKNILVSFSSTNLNQYTITLIDHYGKKIKEISGDALEGMNTATLSASDLSKEIYLIVLTKDNELKIKKILVQ